MRYLLALHVFVQLLTPKVERRKLLFGALSEQIFLVAEKVDFHAAGRQLLRRRRFGYQLLLNEPKLVKIVLAI